RRQSGFSASATEELKTKAGLLAGVPGLAPGGLVVGRFLVLLADQLGDADLLEGLANGIGALVADGLELLVQRGAALLGRSKGLNLTIDGLDDFQDGDVVCGPGKLIAAVGSLDGAKDAMRDERLENLEEEAFGDPLFLVLVRQFRNRVRGNGLVAFLLGHE